MSLEWIVRRRFQQGKLIENRHWLEGQAVRSSLSIHEENDPQRGRVVRSAHLHASLGVPPLCDVQLTAATMSWIALTGTERVRDGKLSDECTYGQSWLIDPAPWEDYRFLETELERLCAMLDERGVAHGTGQRFAAHRQRLAAKRRAGGGAGR